MSKRCRLAANQLTDKDGALGPSVAPLLRAVSGSGFDVLIPWEEMPPQSNPRMELISVELVGGKGGRVTSFAVRLSNPHEFVFSPCHLPLTAVIERGDHPYAEFAQAFYLPQLGDQLADVYAWEDPSDGWEWSEPALLLHRQSSTSAKVVEDAWICGPILKHRQGEAENVGRQWGQFRRGRVRSCEAAGARCWIPGAVAASAPCLQSARSRRLMCRFVSSVVADASDSAITCASW